MKRHIEQALRTLLDEGAVKYGAGDSLKKLLKRYLKSRNIPYSHTDSDDELLSKALAGKP